MNYDIFGRIYHTIAPTGAEYNMVTALKELLQSRDVEISTDNMLNLTVHIKGNGRKTAIAVPMDRNGFVVQYVSDDGKAYLHTECEEKEELKGKEITFYNGVKSRMEIDENKKLYTRAPDKQRLAIGDAAQLAGQWMMNHTTGMLEGLEMASPVAVTIALSFLERFQGNADLYIVFTTHNKVKFLNRGGKILALNHIRPEIAYWVDCAAKTNSENICVEMGDRQYIADRKETQKIFEAAESTGMCVDRCVGVSDDAITDIAFETGVNTVGIYVPMEGNLVNQRVSIQKIEEAVKLLEALC